MKVLRLLLRAVLILCGVVIVITLALLAHGYGLTTRKQANPVPALRVAPDSSLVPRGEHIASIVCASCHSTSYSLPLSGAEENFLAIPNGPTFGFLVSPNLTPGGRVGQYSDGELARAIREGVGKDGRPMLIMPSKEFHALSDRDLAAVIAYLRSQPAVPREEPKKRLNVAGYLVLGLHMFELSNTLPVRQEVPDVEHTASVEHGAYLVSFLGCRSCHGADLRGGKPGQFEPLGPELVELCTTHELAAFDGALRRGISARDGHSLDPAGMPYSAFAHLDDIEVAAIYAYLKSLK